MYNVLNATQKEIIENTFYKVLAVISLVGWISYLAPI